MSFATPQAFFLLLAIPLVLLFHLFRARRREVRISTLRFWQAAKREQDATYSVFRKLRADLLLLLQILALLLATLALADPTVTGLLEGRPRVVLIVDTSASMQATDVPGGRFAAARAAARDVVAGLEGGQQASLLEAAGRPALLVPFTVERGDLEDALAALQPSDEAGDLAAAVALAAELLRDGPPGEIHLFTDGAFPRLAEPTPGSPPLRWHAVGQGSDNVAITALEVRRSLTEADAYEAFLALTNFGPATRNFPVHLTLDGVPLYEQPLDLRAGVTRSIVVPFTRDRGGVLRVEIEPRDNLAADDVAHAVLPRPDPLEVLLVTRGNLFMEQALRTEPRVRLRTVVPELFVAAESDADLVVLDGHAPEALPPGRYLLLGALPGDAPLEDLGTVRSPDVLDWQRDHPATRHLDLSKVAIRQAVKVRIAGDGEVLAESRETPLIFAWDEGAVRAIFLGFDLRRSDLGLRAALPLFVGNALRWLAPGRLDPVAKSYSPGQPIEAHVESGGTSAVVAGPDGRSRPVAAEDGRLVYDGTRTAGLYTSRLEESARRHAVNLLDPEESNLAPRRGIPEPVGAGAAARESHLVPRDLWPLMMALALLVIGVEAALYLHRRRSLASRPALLLRAAVLGLVCLSLFRPQWTVAADVVHAAFLLDRSHSVPDRHKLEALERVQEAFWSRGELDTGRLVVFDSEPRLEAFPDEPGDPPESSLISAGKEPGTDVAGAIRLALAALPREGTRRVLLLSDGNAERASSRRVSRDAGRQGVVIYTLPIGGPAPGEVLLQRLTLPREVKQGEPFDIGIVAWSARDGTGRLSLYRDAAEVTSGSVRLKSGKNRFSYREVQDTEGFHVYRARLEAPGDRIDENDELTGVVAVRGVPRVLYVEKDQAQGRHLLAALEAQRIRVDLASPEGISEALDSLSDYDAVVLGNVSALALTQAQMKRIQSFVRDDGGGLVMLGGEQSFGLGGYYRTPIEETLPVTMESRQKVDVPSMVVVLMIDRSGSMNAEQGRFTRMDLAKEAAQLAVDLLSRRSEVGVMAFDSRARWVVPIGPARDKKAIIREIGSLQAGGGGTELFWAMEDVYEAIATREAVLRHVIVLSDGETLLAGFPELLGQMAQDEITVSTVAISSEAGVELLQNISRWGGGRFYFTGDAYSVPRIFTMETQLASKAGLVEQAFRPSVRRRSHEILKGIDWGAVPPLAGYVTTTPKVVAETLLVSPQQDPILSVWRYGLGRAAAFTSDAKAKWGASWLGWRDFGRFFAQLLRWTLRGSGSGDLATTLRIEGGRGDIEVEVADGEGAFRNFLDVKAGIVMPDESRRVVPLRQSAPGLYEGAFPAETRGAYLAGVSLQKGARVLGSQVAGGVASYAPEYGATSINKRLLAALAKTTGGRMLSDPAEIFQVDRAPTRRTVEAWPWVVLVAVFLLLCDLALRWVASRWTTAG